MKLLDLTGTILGYPLGIATFIVSFLRRSRTFHPHGLHAVASVKVLPESPVTFYQKALVRFSSALWKKKEWPDVLGLTIRFSDTGTITERSDPGDQDLLFASFAHPWQTLIGPALTDHRNFSRNTFYAVSPFLVGSKKVYFKVRFTDQPGGSNREEKLRTLIRKRGTLKLSMKEVVGEWKEVAELTLEGEIDLDERMMAFDPFQCGLHIKPTGLIHHLRIGAYSGSRLGRRLRLSQKEIHNPDDRLIIHGF